MVMTKLEQAEKILSEAKDFKRVYLACVNRSGNSIGPARRTALRNCLYASAPNISVNMEEQMHLEKFCNELFNLCPYGLEAITATDDAAAYAFTKLSKTKEPIMAINSNKAVENITYIYGVDAANVTDDQIFQHIANRELEIKSLEVIENKPKKLAAKIEALHAEIKILVDFVDAR